MAEKETKIATAKDFQIKSLLLENGHVFLLLFKKCNNTLCGSTPSTYVCRKSTTYKGLICKLKVFLSKSFFFAKYAVNVPQESSR